MAFLLVNIDSWIPRHLFRGSVFATLLSVLCIIHDSSFAQQDSTRTLGDSFQAGLWSLKASITENCRVMADSTQDEATHRAAASRIIIACRTFVDKNTETADIFNLTYPTMVLSGAGGAAQKGPSAGLLWSLAALEAFRIGALIGNHYYKTLGEVEHIGYLAKRYHRAKSPKRINRLRNKIIAATEELTK